ncbi:MAG TPA: TonB-dependent receptor [Chitinophagales bacterium]|nr:TonB-dependent receptor [Chitinophagales bacterium]
MYRLLIFITFSSFIFSAFAQDSSLRSSEKNCNIIIKGQVIDEHDSSVLDYAGVYILELQRGWSTDSNGIFEEKGFCPGTYTFRLSHVGCETRDTTIQINKNTSLLLNLEHHVLELKLTEVYAHPTLKEKVFFQENIQAIDLKDPSKDLGEILSNITGVNQLQTGTNIFKPIIHGLHSDRIVILQNEVKLSGQSWGAEHAPEIDAASSQSIDVIKGSASVEFGTDAMGGVVNIEQASSNFDTIWSGKINTSFNSNQLGTATHARIAKGWESKKNAKVYLQFGGTFKRFGDARAPKYVISNSGMLESNGYAALGFQKMFKNFQLESQSYYNYYLRKNGILAASHIGNIEDLENAIQNNKPTIILPWTYKISYPYQQTVHHTVKQQFQFNTSWAKYFLQYDAQIDQREEFDLRRNNRSDIPVMDINLLTHHLSAKLIKPIHQNKLKAGLELYLKDNLNTPGTGIRPIIPNYSHQNMGAWMHYQMKFNKFELDAGWRYEFNKYNVSTFNDQKELIQPSHTFYNFALATTSSYNISSILNWTSGLSLSSRAPSINELYSQGVHQSAAAIEYGDDQMKSELSFKWTNKFDLKWTDKAQLTFTPYINIIKDFIYLNPQKDYEVTIRGAFPVFKYQQLGMINLGGIDADITYYPIPNFVKIQGQYSFIRMIEFKSRYDLIGTPPNQLKLTAALERSHWGKLLNVYAGLEWKYVGEQFHVNPKGDFLAPPSAYHLLSFDSNLEWNIKSNTMGVGFQVNNITNTSYRDYLDRFRYFSDLTGINFIIKWFFTF